MLRFRQPAEIFSAFEALNKMPPRVFRRRRAAAAARFIFHVQILRIFPRITIYFLAVTVQIKPRDICRNSATELLSTAGIAIANIPPDFSRRQRERATSHEYRDAAVFADEQVRVMPQQTQKASFSSEINTTASHRRCRHGGHFYASA